MSPRFGRQGLVRGKLGAMRINFTYDQATTSLPSGMTQALSVAAAYLDHLFASPIVVNVEVGYGEITQNGQTDPVSSGAEGGFTNNQYMSYSAFRFLYADVATSPDQRLALANMPTSNPFGGASIDVSYAQLKAFGQATN